VSSEPFLKRYAGGPTNLGGMGFLAAGAYGDDAEPMRQLPQLHKDDAQTVKSNITCQERRGEDRVTRDLKARITGGLGRCANLGYG
jgi:hypothetical protein